MSILGLRARRANVLAFMLGKMRKNLQDGGPQRPAGPITRGELLDHVDLMLDVAVGTFDSELRGLSEPPAPNDEVARIVALIVEGKNQRKGVPA